MVVDGEGCSVRGKCLTVCSGGVSESMSVPSSVSVSFPFLDALPSFTVMVVVELFSVMERFGFGRFDSILTIRSGSVVHDSYSDSIRLDSIRLRFDSVRDSIRDSIRFVIRFWLQVGLITLPLGFRLAGIRFGLDSIRL